MLQDVVVYTYMLGYAKCMLPCNLSSSGQHCLTLQRLTVVHLSLAFAI